MSPRITSGRRAGRLMAVLTAGALALSACSATNTAGPSSSEPVSGGTLKIATTADAQPQFILSFRLPNLSWQKLVFEPLLEIGDDGEPAPVLATDWSVDESAHTMTLHIREGVEFHDGRALTADDVVGTLELARDPANASQLMAVAKAISFEATDAHEVVISYPDSVGPVFDLLGMTPIVDPQTFSGITEGDVNGTGPFTWVKWSPGASIDLEKNPDYWNPERPYFDAVEISILGGATALRSALASGAADIAMGMPIRDALMLNDAQFELVTSFQGVVYPLGLNVTEAPFDNIDVRRAVGYAIDSDRILDQVFFGEGLATDLWWTPNRDDYPTGLEDEYPYDPDKARKLLENTGAVGAEVTIAYNSNIPEMVSIYEVVQNNLEAVGLKVTDNAMPATEYGPAQAKGTLGQAFLLLHGQIGLSAPTIADSMPSIKKGNPSHFWTDEYGDLMDAMKSATEADRPAALRKLSEYALDQAFSHVIAVAPWKYVVNKSIDGIDVSPLGALIVTDAHSTEGGAS